MQRISIRGTTGSGKSTLAKALAKKLDLQHIEIDALHHLPGWNTVSKKSFAIVLTKLCKPSDG